MRTAASTTDGEGDERAPVEAPLAAPVSTISGR
jgi:hypothetical protein